MVVAVAQHYASHLAPVYLWMAGGFEGAVARGAAEVDAVCPKPPGARIAVDLGAGFGMHAIPLARLGYSVVAIDNSAILLEILRKSTGSLPVRAIEDDLLNFPKHLDAKADLILCMGDTLTHLPEMQSVEDLVCLAAESLRAGGRFIATFRDYTTALAGTSRFIPVRSDADRILTCFLEYSAEHVTVHDILHERDGANWQQRVSAYRKLRLDPAWVSKTLEAHGFLVRIEPGLSGMTRVIATRT